MQRKIYLLILLFIVLLPVRSIFSQSSSTNYITQRFVVVSGDSADSAHYKSTSVVGQPATDVTISRNYKVNGGFLFPRTNTIPTAISVSTTADSPALPLSLIIVTAILLLTVAAYLHRHQS